MKRLIGQQESNRKHQEKRRRLAGVLSRGQERIKNMQLFLEVSEKIHKNKYDYTGVVYLNSISKIKIKCPKHDEFLQTPHAHKSGQGCPKCALDKKHNGFRKSLQSFIEDASIVHNNRYDYSKSLYINNKSKINIICVKHGIFSQRAGMHLRGQGCPCCGAEARASISMSKGEVRISNFLNEHSTDFISQKSFKGCKYINSLSFDFYLPQKNTLIEFDGEQHYRFIKKFHNNMDGFKTQKIRDNIKTQYAIDNDINLLRIRWDEIDIIADILHKLISGDN